MNLSEYKAGGYEQQYEYRSFVPTSIRHEWLISDPEVIELLGRADRALGELNAFAQLVPDIDFFIRTYIAKEATQSSRIEGTQTNMEDAFKAAEDLSPEARDDWQEVQNYIKAINDAVDELERLPFSNRLLRKAHETLMQGVRGKTKQPGEFRRSQNWIGVSLKNAVFVPPHHEHVSELMSDMEKFLHDDAIRVPPLIRIAIAHYQFETIHPFLDGNGRLGRLMISLYLASKGLLKKPALYLSDYFERNKTAYVDHLMAVREGNHMRAWLIFFLHGVEETALEAVDVFRKILKLKEEIERKVLPHFRSRRQENAQQLLRFLYEKPLMDVKMAANLLNTTTNTATSLITDFKKHGVLVEITGQRRNRLFSFHRYLRLFSDSIVDSLKSTKMTNIHIPSVSVSYAHNGSSTKANELGMRPMQERAYAHRGEQYLLIKSPPASGKSRALMFIALDKLANQGLRQAIIVVPEKTIGASFHDEPLSQFGFFTDWRVEPRWNLCNASGTDGGKVDAVGKFLESEDKVLICTHATFRFAVDKFGVEKFDNRLIAVDEFHHVSANPDNKLGLQLGQFIARDKVHIVAMTGSYFRGDADAVLAPQDEALFDTVTYTYYEQLNGYEHLKRLDIGYFFYSGSYVDDILKVLDPAEKTIVHIPNVNSRESTRDKIREVEHIIEELGEWQGTDAATGFQLVRTPEGRVLRIADLVDDDPAKRDRVSMALKDPTQKNNRDHVDIIIALGMAKEGFDWIWCEHALTVGYRSSLTEIVQIIGRATRDAPEKTRTRFTNLIAEPDASQQAVAEAVNDTLKAIAASLLMEQVLAPRFEFRAKNPANEATPGFDYGDDGYQPGKGNVGFNGETGQFQIEIKGLVEPKSEEAARICREDLNEVIASFVQDKNTIERGLFDTELVPEELTQARIGKIIKDKYPGLDEEDQEAVRQHAIAALSLMQQAKRVAFDESGQGDGESAANTALIDGVRRYVMNVRELDIDLIDRINPFSEAFAILSKAMTPDSLKQVVAAIAVKRTSLTPEEARELAVRAVRFKQEHGRLPSIMSPDAWEKRMAEGAAAFVRFKDGGRYE